MKKKEFFIVNDEPVSYADGVKTIMRVNHWNQEQLALKLNVSHRTVEGWERGRNPNKSALLILQSLLTAATESASIPQ